MLALENLQKCFTNRSNMTDFEFCIENDEESEENEMQWGGKDATIFLIDASPEMLNTSFGDESAFLKALRCTHSTISRKIIGGDHDLSSVVLFNTKESKNALEFSKIFVLQDIDHPGAERILQLETFLEDGGKKVAETTFGSSNESSVQEVLWVCRYLFKSCKSKLSGKTVLLFTSNDDPHPNDDHTKRLAYKGAKDLFEAGIDLEILPLSEGFDTNKFYKDLLLEGRDEDSQEALSILADPTVRMEELLDRVRRFDHKQRSTGRVPFTLAPGLEIGVKVYTSNRKTYKPPKTNLYKGTNEEVITKRKEFLEDGELLMPSDFSKYQTYGEKKIKFTVDETKSLSALYEPGIEVLGFKPISVLKPYLYVKPSNFIYPDESSVKGSNRLFSCLLDRCLNRQVCPIVRFVARQSSLSWGFLLPQSEEKDDKNCQIKPPGFHICHLPFADDFRNIELQNRTRANTRQVDAVKDVLKKLNFKYHPESFDNPDIQTHWRNLEALALNRSYLEPVTDYTVPDYARIEKKAGSLIDEFKSLVFSPDYDPTKVIKKRPVVAGADRAAPAPKKTKAEDASVEDMAKCHSVDKLKVDVLKQWLIARGIRVTGKLKPQLVQDVYDALS